ncbi:hypothetical protein IIA15_07325 [candidate division TA06 bacterium]|nr:hypothetical protein [candidate division TA06 bacterium]
MKKSCLKCIFLGINLQGDWVCGKQMVAHFKKALKSKTMETDCLAYEFVKGMTFLDRARRMIKDVAKSGKENDE